MKKVDFSALVSDSLESLFQKLKESRREELRLRMAVKTGGEKNTSKYLLAKKDIARILTAIRIKELSELTV